MIALQFFDDLGSDFWLHGPGAARWSTVKHKDGTGPYTVLMVILPGNTGLHMLHVEHESGNWASPGPEVGWNGDYEYPSFRPSIQTNAGDGWHGFIKKGYICENPQEVDGSPELW